MKRKAIIVDLDGTLSDSSARKHFVEGRSNGEGRDFDAFYDHLSEDPPNEWCCDIVRKYRPDHAVLLVTGRPGKYKVADDTVEWLHRNFIQFDKLYFRKVGDFRQDYLVKKEIYMNKIVDEFEVVFCVDDRKQVVDMWRSLGLVCLQCADGNF